MSRSNGAHSSRHTIVALLQDHPGALNRAVSLFRRRGYNICSVNVGPSEVDGISRVTLTVEADDVKPVVQQLDRLVEIVRVSNVTTLPRLERETALVRVSAAGTRAEIAAIVAACSGRVLDVAADSMMVEQTATPREIDDFIELLRPYGIEELSRSGCIAMVRPPRNPINEQ